MNATQEQAYRDIVDYFKSLTGKPTIESLDRIISEIGYHLPETDRDVIRNEYLRNEVVLLDLHQPKPKLTTTTEYVSTDTIGKYEIIQELGGGGQGVVYLCRDPDLDISVAIKRLWHSYDNDLINEARIAARLVNPNIVTIHYLDLAITEPYVVMEFIPNSIKTMLNEFGSIEWKDAARLVIGICNGLEFAHTKNIVHRDIKPENILLSKSENNGEFTWIPKIADFGIARRFSSQDLESTEFIGSIFYMPPEQWQGRPIDGRSDLYALGIMLFEMITGDVPFRAYGHQLMSMHHNNPTPRIKRFGVPKSLSDIISTATAKEPNARFTNAKEMALALEKCLSESTSLTFTQTRPKNIPIARTYEFYAAGYFLAIHGENTPNKPAKPPKIIGTKTWNDTYDYFYDVLGNGRSRIAFRNSLKNTRDMYDAYTDAGRVGWREKNGDRKPAGLTNLGSKVMQDWQASDHDTIWAYIQEILGH